MILNLSNKIYFLFYSSKEKNQSVLTGFDDWFLIVQYYLDYPIWIFFLMAHL